MQSPLRAPTKIFPGSIISVLISRLEQVLKGIKSLQARTRKRSLPRLPITPNLLLKMKGVWQKRGTTWDNTMLWAAVPGLGSTGI